HPIDDLADGVPLFLQRVRAVHDERQSEHTNDHVSLDSTRAPRSVRDTRRPPKSRLCEARPDGLQLVSLDDVPFLEIVEILDPDAALEALVDFLHVVLEAPQRGDLAGEDGLR